jgi:hypothetical protein
MKVKPKIEWPKKETTWIIDKTLFISIPFTWRLPVVRKFLLQKQLFSDKVVIGGPAVKLMPSYFDDFDCVKTGGEWHGVLQRVNNLATQTTRGCTNQCGFCAVPKTEGKFCELDDWPDLPVLCDNNLLASSQLHFDKVCDRLEKHTWCDFNQGLDCRLMTDYHAERLARLPNAIVRLALDRLQESSQWEKAFSLLMKYKFPKSRMRSYVLFGYKSGIADAWDRCNFVDSHGVLPCPQFFHPLNSMTYNAVMPCHQEYGWTEKEKNRMMQFWYKHRGVKFSQGQKPH